MNKATFFIFLLLLLGIAGGVAWYLVHTSGVTLRQEENVQIIVPELSESKAIYTNGIYGFTVLYPENSVVNYEFSTAYHLPAAWRASATEDEVGNQVLELVPFTTESTTSYPRYYTTLVRIGASADPETLRTCLVATKDQGEIALADREINGTTFKVFSFQNAGMMQYVEGVSYRTIHEEQCIALEKIRVGSSYKEDGVGEGDISEETLNTAYNSLDEIVESFRFAR